MHSVLESLLQLVSAPRPRLLVVGDLMLDQVIDVMPTKFGDGTAIPCYGESVCLDRPGGAAAVACLAAALGADVTLAGLVGEDEAGRRLTAHLAATQSVQLASDCVAPLRVGVQTTVRTRFVLSGPAGPRPLWRVDRNRVDDRSGYYDPAPLVAGADVVLVADHARGFCCSSTLHCLFAAAKPAKVPVIVDPHVDTDPSIYHGATAIKGNRGELDRHHPDQMRGWSLVNACRSLGLAWGIVTDGHRGLGLVVPSQRNPWLWLDGHRAQLVDETGAGDQVLATLGVALAAGLPLAAAAELANWTAARQVERFGVEPIPRRALISRALREFAQPAVPEGEIAAFSALHRAVNRRVVFTNGCFDGLHPGHAAHLEAAAAAGDVLIVAINSDESCRRLKGTDRPRLPEPFRVAQVAALPCVSHVTVFGADTPLELIDRIRPDVLAKGGTTAEIVGADLVASYGGRVLRTPQHGNYSSTSLWA